MTFKKGESGNPRGRPKGIKDRRTSLRSLLEPHAKDLVQKAVDLALAGDTGALRLCIDRLIPPARARDESVLLDLPEGGNLTACGAEVVRSMGVGAIAPAQAAAMLQALAAQARVKEMDELEQRVANLEQVHGG